MTAQAPDPRPLAGEPLALDLLNTQWLASGTPVDLLATQDGTRAWLAAAAIAVPPSPQTRQALIAARQAIRDVLAQQNGDGRRAAVSAERGWAPSGGGRGARGRDKQSAEAGEAEPGGGESRARGREEQSGSEALGRLNAVLGHGRLRLSIGPPLSPAK